jgi:hypothetical protein
MNCSRTQFRDHRRIEPKTSNLADYFQSFDCLILVVHYRNLRRFGIFSERQIHSDSRLAGDLLSFQITIVLDSMLAVDCRNVSLKNIAAKSRIEHCISLSWQLWKLRRRLFRFATTIKLS